MKAQLQAQLGWATGKFGWQLPCDSQESQRSRRPEEGDSAFSWPCQAELAVPAPLSGPFEHLLLRISYYFPAGSPVHLSCALRAFFYAAMPAPWPFLSLRAAHSFWLLLIF